MKLICGIVSTRTPEKDNYRPRKAGEMGRPQSKRAPRVAWPKQPVISFGSRSFAPLPQILLSDRAGVLVVCSKDAYCIDWHLTRLATSGDQ